MTPAGKPTIAPGKQLEEGESTICRLLSQGSYFPLNSALIRAAPLRRIPQLDERMRLCDFPMWLALSRTGSFRYAPGLVGLVRKHATSMSQREHLTGDRLRLLGRNATSPEERRAARVRGRYLLNGASIAGSRPPAGAYLEYGLNARDWRAVPACLASVIPGSQRVLQRIREARNAFVN